MNSVRDMKICSAVLITACLAVGLLAFVWGIQDGHFFRGAFVLLAMSFVAWLELHFMCSYLDKLGPWPIVRMGNDFVINDGRK